MDRDMIALELDKVLELLAKETSCADAAQLARELVPVPYRKEAERLLDETDAACRLMAGFGSPSFGALKNTANALRRAAAGAVLSLRELLDIGETLRVIRSLAEWYAHCAGAQTVLDDRFHTLSPNKYLEDRINTTVVSEEEIADGASPLLADLRRKKRAASARIREQLDHMVRSPAYQKLLQDPIVTIRDGRFVVPVRVEHRSEVPGLVHDTSASGATVFIEPMSSVEANNELRVLESKEEAEIERILAALSAEVGSFADGIIADYTAVTELDLIFAKARLAYRMKAMRPALTDDGHILLHGARHPLLDPQKAVPINVELGGAFDTLVITGPNTGGKTVTLKTLGLLTLMVMCGLLPPVRDGSSLSVFDRVLADIGDEQSIEQSLSTFSAHMTNLIRILKEADDRTLVLTDELGAGTDPVEGAALAIAILERLRQQGARIAATTHYAELKAFALNTPGVENGSCEFDVATLRPTYRLLIGTPGRSNAFAISRRLGMDETLVDRAKELVSGDDRRLEETVVRLDERRQALERELKEARFAGEMADTHRKEAEAQLADARKKQEQVLENARAEARALVEKARNEAEQLIADLNALRREKDSADFAARTQDAQRQLRAKMRSLEEAVDPVTARPTEGYALPRPLKAGDDVRIVDIDKKGVVVTPPDKNGMTEVQAGIIRTRVPVSNLRLLDRSGRTVQKGQKPPAVRMTLESRASRSAKSELDLRGKSVEEALYETDAFIDGAVMAGLGTVTLIHGKGTGALRAAIHAHLKGHPSVKRFRLGVYGEGETGVTVVELK